MKYDGFYSKDKFFLALIFLSSISPAMSNFTPQVSNLEDLLLLTSMLIGFVYFVRHILISKKVNASVVFFFCYVLFSLFASSIHGVPYEKYVKIFLYEGKFMLLALSVLYWKKTNDNFFLAGIGYIAIFQFVFSLFELMNLYGVKENLAALTFSNADDYYIDNVIDGGVFGTMMSKNMLGYFFVFVFVSYYYLADLDQKFNRFVFSLCFLGVIMSQSRTALIFLIAFVFLKVLRNRGRIVLLYISPLLLIILLFLLSDYLPKSFNEIFSAKYYENVFSVGRGAYIIASIAIITNNPFGVGAGNWGLGLAFDPDLLHNQIIYYNSFQIPLGVFQDNNWLSLLTQYGFISFLSFLIFWKFIASSSCVEDARINEFKRVILILMLYCSFFIAGFTTKVLMFIFLYFISKREGSHENITCP